MMSCLTGRERTLDEFKQLIQKAGLKFSRFVDIGTPSKSIVECEKPDLKTQKIYTLFIQRKSG